MHTTANKALKEAIRKRTMQRPAAGSWGKFRHYRALQEMFLEYTLSGRIQGFTTKEHNEFFTSFTEISELVFDLETMAARSGP